MFTNEQIIDKLILCFDNERYNELTIENIQRMSADDLRTMVTILKAIFDCQVPNPKTTKPANIENIKHIYNNKELQQMFYPIHSGNKQSTKNIYERLRQQLGVQDIKHLKNNNDNNGITMKQSIQLFPNDLINLKPKYQQFKLLLYVGLFDITTDKYFMQSIDIRPEKDICYVIIFHQLKLQETLSNGEKVYYQCPLTPKTDQMEVLYINGQQLEFMLDGEYQIIKLEQLNGNHQTYQFDVECVQYGLDHRSYRQFCSIYLAKQMNLDQNFRDIFKRQLYLPAPMYKFLERQSYLHVIQEFNNLPINILQEKDDDVEIGGFKLIPICQISKNIIQFPVIGKNCQHWQICMDLNTYLTKNDSKCYICNKQTKYEDLIVHAVFYYINEQKISKLVISEDGELTEVVMNQQTSQNEEFSDWS